VTGSRRSPKKALDAAQWERVFFLRCKSKRGESVTDEDQRLLVAAYRSDPGRYGDLNADVFNATVPIGSSVRYRKP
jgi:hypothetical protein